jgi:succinate dehydrogenase hydrophobic anchor subunit
VIDIEIERTHSEFAQPQRRSAAWLWQAASGVVLLALLTLHMIANHFVVDGGIRTYAQVVDYLRTPVIFALEHLFLLTVTLHAMLGVRAVLFDFGLTPATERRASTVLAGLGAVTVAYGVWLLWAVAY